MYLTKKVHFVRQITLGLNDSWAEWVWNIRFTTETLLSGLFKWAQTLQRNGYFISSMSWLHMETNQIFGMGILTVFSTWNAENFLGLSKLIKVNQNP